MTTGYKKSDNTDLDSIFAARGSLTARADVGIKVGTQDLADRFAQVSYGAAADAATGFKIANGTDLQNVFAKTGSLVWEFHFDADQNSLQNIATILANWGYSSQPSVTIYVDSGKTLSQGMTTGSIPASVTSLTIVNNGAIYGAFGAGGLGGIRNPTLLEKGGDGSAGTAGGAAITVTKNCTINVGSTGVIKGGGGGGGGGGAATSAASGGNGGRGAGGQSNTFVAGSDGEEAGTGRFGYGYGGTTAGANGGIGILEAAIAGGGGGAGGDWASAGGAGGNISSEYNAAICGIGGAGGAAGKAIEYNGNTVSLTNNGTITGATS